MICKAFAVGPFDKANRMRRCALCNRAGWGEFTRSEGLCDLVIIVQFTGIHSLQIPGRPNFLAGDIFNICNVKTARLGRNALRRAVSIQGRHGEVKAKIFFHFFSNFIEVGNACSDLTQGYILDVLRPNHWGTQSGSSCKSSRGSRALKQISAA